MDEFVIRLFVCITLQKLIVRTLQAFSSEPALSATKQYVILASWPPSFPTGDVAETKTQ